MSTRSPTKSESKKSVSKNEQGETTSVINKKTTLFEKRMTQLDDALDLMMGALMREKSADNFTLARALIEPTYNFLVKQTEQGTT